MLRSSKTKFVEKLKVCIGSDYVMVAVNDIIQFRFVSNLRINMSESYFIQIYLSSKLH